jgi:1,4-dihydroxy-2-naphthoate octaprenyltransferase
MRILGLWKFPNAANGTVLILIIHENHEKNTKSIKNMEQTEYRGQTMNIKQNSLQAWALAIRPKTLAAAVAPVVVWAALAKNVGTFDWFPAIACLIFAVSMQIAANLINDLFDYLKGSDRTDRLGPERVTSQGWVSVSAMKFAIVLVIALGCLAGLPMIHYGGWAMLAVGAVCAVFAYAYTSGPFPLAYHGLGDVAVVIFFGVVPVGFTFYVQTQNWTPQVTLFGVAVGLVVNTLLVLNNFRDRDADRLSGKRTLIVLFGKRFGSCLYLFSGVIAVLFVWLSFLMNNDFISPAAVSFYLLPHIFTWRKMIKIQEGTALNKLLGETSRNMLLFAFLLSGVLILLKL